MKKFKNILLLISLLLLSGCIKNKTTLTINNDKSINYTNDLLIKTDYAEEFSKEFNSEEYNSKGFKVTTINDDGYSGYRISNEYQTIDNMANNNGEVVVISDITEDGFDLSKVFKREKGFIKDTYIANFVYKVDTNSLNNSDKSNEDLNFEDENNLENDNTEESFDLDNSDLSSLSSFGEMEFSFTVNLPMKANTHNATSTLNNDKTLKWTLNENGDTNISFSFSLFNFKTIIITVASVIGFILLIILIVVFIKKKKSNKKMLIYKSFDPSVSKGLNENINDNQVNQVNSAPSFEPTKVNSLEFTISEEEMQRHKEQEEIKKQEIENNLSAAKPKVVAPPSVDYNVRPDFVRDNEKKVFIQENEVKKQEEIPKINSIELDIPDAISFSDMDKKE